MNFYGVRFGMCVLAVLLSLSIVLAKSVDPSEFELYQSQNELNENQFEDPIRNGKLFRYLLMRELLEGNNDMEWAMRQRTRQRQQIEQNDKNKKGYWKACAFNAVSCFGKK